MIGCDTLPIYISAARPAKHEEELLRGQTVSIYLLLLVSTLLLTKPFYVVFCSGIQLTIDRLDHSGHLIPRFKTKLFG